MSSSSSSTPSYYYDYIIDPQRSAQDRIDSVTALSDRFQQSPQAYWTLGNLSASTSHHLPPLEWQASFRKAYTIFFWIRPRREEEEREGKTSCSIQVETTATQDGLSSSSSSAQQQQPGILYRFASEQSHQGVLVTTDEWIELPETTTTTDDDDDDDDANTRKKKKNVQIQTTLTAMALQNTTNNNASSDEAKQPLLSSSSSSSSSAAAANATTAVRMPLTLTLDEWHLVACTHVCPYLKRPQWTLTVNGQVQGTMALPYPDASTVLLQHNVVLQNIVPPPPTTTTATTTTAKNDNGNSKNKNILTHLDVASLALYPMAIPAPWQAVLAEAGPQLSVQQDGRILTLIPPVANWAKGSSLDSGTPKVGIPLVVHAAALEIQQAADTIVMGVSALRGRSLGGRGTMAKDDDDDDTDATTTTATTVHHHHHHHHHERLVLPVHVPAGMTQGTPRVGLVQPSPPPHIRYDNHEDDWPSVYVTGDVQLVQQQAAEQQQQQQQQQEKSSNVVVLADADVEQLLSSIVLPFFLSLPPPGKLFDRQESLYNNSLRQLYALYYSSSSSISPPRQQQQEGGGGGGQFQLLLAAALIDSLTTAIEYGGARVAEVVLQSGCIHVLASCLRLSCLRAARGGGSGSGSGSNVNTESSTSTTSLSFSEWVRRFKQRSPPEDAVVSPRQVPVAVVQACARLIAVCCGPPAPKLDDVSPAMRVRRTSDLALTALFGLALDLDLWGGDAEAAAIIYTTVAERYGGFCVTYGYILRSQVSVQYFLDTIRLHYDSQPASSALQMVGDQLSRLVMAMLLASLSNRRSISQGESDVAACMGVLSDCPLGSIGAHVVLNAIVSVLTWCEILPVEAVAFVGEHNPDEDQKMQVATRLGRNLLMSQFHDVVAPMLLSRTVFSAESSMVQPKNSSSQKAAAAYCGTLSWQSHWRISLLLFSWVASLAGPEGLVAAKSSGSLLLASGLAGSLNGALDDAEKAVISALYLPPPGMALMIGSTLRSEWSYTDLMSDRLQIMIPLLPGMVVCLLSHPMYSSRDTAISSKSLTVLAEILTSVGGAFHRVFGGTIHQTEGTRPHVKSRRDGSSESVKAAKTFVPHLLVVAMLLENHISLRSPPPSEEEAVVVFRPQVSREKMKTIDLDSWVDVSSTASESVIGDIVVELPSGDVESNDDSVISCLKSCEKAVLNTAAGLVSNAMSHGGAGAAITLWQSILSTLNESVAYAATENSQRLQKDRPVDLDTTKEATEDSKGSDNEPSEDEKVTEGKPAEDEKEAARVDSVDPGDQSQAMILSLNVLCRLVSLVLIKALKRSDKWEVWSYELSSAVSKVCVLVEEKELLQKPLRGGTVANSLLSDDQIVLLSTLLEVLAYGRDATGWCQLPLPVMSPAIANNKSGKPTGDLSAASRLLLPVLQPCLRSVMSCLEYISSKTRIEVPSGPTGQEDVAAEPSVSEPRVESLLASTLSELDLTLTAAIVGLSFSNARDLALSAMAVLRRAANRHQQIGDETASQTCTSLLTKVAEELRVRYEGERRLRETALFDAYEDDATGAAQDAAKGAQAVERLILGGDVLGSGAPDHDASQEITFEPNSPRKGKGSVSDDFVLFHEPSAASSQTGTEKNSRLGYAQYVGLGAALEECKMISESTASESETGNPEKIVSILAPYLDSWDATVERDAGESEFVSLFGTSLQIYSRDENPLKADETPSMQSQQLPIVGSETAADSMLAFAELTAVEKQRLKGVSNGFLPSHRYGRMAYAERFCWARYMEVAPDECSDDIWERGIPDGNRDIRSRLPTTPCSPQFRRYIPKYLDHYSEVDAPDRASGSDVMVDNSEDSARRTSIPGEIDAFTKTLLEAGNLEIVDITKKENAEEDEEPEIDLRVRTNTMDEDDHLFTDTVHADGFDSTLSDNEEELNPEQLEAKEREQSTNDDEFLSQIEVSSEHVNEIITKGPQSITTSAFSTPPDNASSSLSLVNSAAASMIENHFEDCLHVKAEGSRQCSVLLTASHLILEFDGEPDGFFEGEVLAAQEDAERQRILKESGESKEQQGPDEIHRRKDERRRREVAALRPKSIRFNLSEVSHIYLRRYRLRDSSLEIFFIPSGGAAFGGYGMFSPSSSLFLDFGPGHEGTTRRDEAAFAIMGRTPPQALKQWPDNSAQFLHEQLTRLTVGWVEGRITNMDYLLHLNMLAGRSYNDICQYPVFPWVLADYESEEIPDLTDRNSFRDLSKPVGALNPDRLEEFIERFNTFSDPSIPPFMYGSHYSTSAGVVLHFLVRLHPFAGLHRQLQSGHFDVADRLFSSVPRTWGMCTGTSAAEVKELTPEWYCNPTFLKNVNGFKLGTSQDGDKLGDVELPPWAKGSPEKFVEIMRAALESDICSEMLPDWIDLIFGRKQQGPEAIKANNVFFYLTYYGSVDVASIEDEALRQATECQIAHFGQCPRQLFKRPHVRRLPRDYRFRRLSFYQLISAYSQEFREMGDASPNKDEEQTVSEDASSTITKVTRRNIFGEPAFLPFFSAPISHWVHLDAPPPGPHAALIAVRFAGTDRCLAVDARGIFHTFRWVWRTEEALPDAPKEDSNFDKGCFVAQRELPRFRSVPRLMHMPPSGQTTAVAVSKTLFAGRSVLLVLSDGDGHGALGMQLVEPSKGHVRGEVLVPAAHSKQITCIATDPIGTAAGHGGVGGELAVVGSADGSASLWRFMSSHYLPLRPRVRLRGHEFEKISAVALCSSIQIAATLSTEKCCIHSIGNGTLIRRFEPPSNTLDFHDTDDAKIVTKFADAPGLAVSVQGFLVTVCESTIQFKAAPERKVITLHLFTLEGVSLGSKPLESWRGLPQKMVCTPDGTALMVCCGRGITIHRLSACQPLEILDEWQITESDDLGSEKPVESAFDVDLGPSINRPVVAAAACSNGVLRLHALPGISAWSERHKKSGLSQTVGTALAKPAQRLNRAVRDTVGLGRQLAGMGRDIGREVTSDVKERGVGGFLGSIMSRKNSRRFDEK